jgi:hypothetical protein
VGWEQRRGTAVVAYRIRIRGTGIDKMEWEGPHFIVMHNAEQCGPIEESDSSVQWQSDRAGVHSRSAEAQW